MVNKPKTEKNSSFSLMVIVKPLSYNMQFMQITWLHHYYDRHVNILILMLVRGFCPAERAKIAIIFLMCFCDKNCQIYYHVPCTYLKLNTPHAAYKHKINITPYLLYLDLLVKRINS